MYKPFNVNFDLGLNTNDSPKKIKDGECQIAQDCNFDTNGSIFSRNWNLIHKSPGYNVKTIFPYSNLIYHTENGDLYDGNTLIGSGYGSVPFSSLEYNDIWYGVNRSNKLRYNKITKLLHNIGNNAPLAAPTVADSGDAGNPNGSYYYKYTYEDINGKESSYSSVSNEVVVVTNKVNVTLVASAETKVLYINIYRLGGTLTDWYFLAQTTNTNQVYSDNISDSSLTELAFTDNNNPPINLYFITEHYQRIIGARTTDYPNSIEYTVEYEPEYWGNALNQQYLLGGNDECTGLLSWGRFIVFCKKHQIYVMEGSDPSEWHRRRSDAEQGNVSPYAISFYKLPIICTYDGLYFFDGNLITKFSQRVDPFFDGDNSQYLETAVSAIYRNKYYFGLPNNTTLVYDLLDNKFFTYKFGLYSIKYDYLNNFLYGGVGANLCKLEQTTNDDNESVNFHIKSKAYSLHDVEGRLGELKDYIVQIDTKSEDVSFNIYIDEELLQTITLNTSSMQTVSGTFLHNMGCYAEFEFIYTGTKRIQIDVPVIINQTRDTLKNA